MLRYLGFHDWEAEVQAGQLCAWRHHHTCSGQLPFLLIGRSFGAPFYFDLLRQVNEAGTYIVAAESGDLLYWDMATRKVVSTSPTIGCQHPTCPGGPPGETREHPADLLLQEPVALCRRQQEGKQGQRIRALRVQVFRKS